MCSRQEVVETPHADGNEIPSASQSGRARLAVRRLGSVLARRMGQIPPAFSGDGGKGPLPSGPVVAGILLANRTIHLAFGENRAMNGVAMNTFTIDTNNNITAFASLVEARAAKIHNAEYFGSAQ
jgi:hypothetical protein